MSGKKFKQFRTVKLFSINKVSLVFLKTGRTRDNPYWIAKENSLKLIKLCSKNKVSLV